MKISDNIAVDMNKGGGGKASNRLFNSTPYVKIET